MRILPAFSHSVAAPRSRRAISRLGQLSIGADARLSVRTPKQSVVRRLYCGIRLSQNELSLPAQRWTKIRMLDIEAIRLANYFLCDHAAPPAAAFRIARFSATRANCTL